MTTEREAHLDKLADAVIERLQNDSDEYWCGLDAKRPFGFSGRYSIARDVAEIVGVEPQGEDGELIDDQMDYSYELLADVPDHIRKRWRAKS